jgi:hypothetical protein
MVALGTRQATASKTVCVDLSVDSPGCHRMGTGAQAESSSNKWNTVVGPELASLSCTAVVVAGT